MGGSEARTSTSGFGDLCLRVWGPRACPCNLHTPEVGDCGTLWEPSDTGPPGLRDLGVSGELRQNPGHPGAVSGAEFLEIDACCGVIPTGLSDPQDGESKDSRVPGLTPNTLGVLSVSQWIRRDCLGLLFP